MSYARNAKGRLWEMRGKGRGHRQGSVCGRRRAPDNASVVHVFKAVDVRGLREKLHMTQADFAWTVGFRLATLRHGVRIHESR